MRRLLGSVTAAAIALAPTVAIAQQAPAPVQTEEVGAQLGDDDNDLLLWILGAGGIAIIIYFVFIKGGDDDDEEEELPPTSP